MEIKISENMAKQGNTLNNISTAFFTHKNLTQNLLMSYETTLSILIQELQKFLNFFFSVASQISKLEMAMNEMGHNVTEANLKSFEETQSKFDNFTRVHTKILDELHKNQTDFVSKQVKELKAHQANHTSLNYQQLEKKMADIHVNISKKLKKFSQSQNKTLENHSTMWETLSKKLNKKQMASHKTITDNASSHLNKKIEKHQKSTMFWGILLCAVIIGAIVVVCCCFMCCFGMLYYKISKTHKATKNVWHTVGPNCPACAESKKTRPYAPPKRTVLDEEEGLEMQELMPKSSCQPDIECEALSVPAKTSLVNENFGGARPKIRKSEVDSETTDSPDSPAVLEIPNPSSHVGEVQPSGVKNLRRVFEQPRWRV